MYFPVWASFKCAIQGASSIRSDRAALAPLNDSFDSNRQSTSEFISCSEFIRENSTVQENPDRLNPPNIRSSAPGLKKPEPENSCFCLTVALSQPSFYSTKINWNKVMLTTQEKTDFSARLKCALRESNRPVHGAVELARLFNQQYCPGISVQTAHKWLSGRAIPDTYKMRMLAEWLGVPEQQLRDDSPHLA